MNPDKDPSPEAHIVYSDPRFCLIYQEILLEIRTDHLLPSINPVTTDRKNYGQRRR